MRIGKEITAAEALANAQAWYDEKYPIISLSTIFEEIEKASLEGKRCLLDSRHRILPEDILSLKNLGYDVRLRKYADFPDTVKTIDISWEKGGGV